MAHRAATQTVSTAATPERIDGTAGNDVLIGHANSTLVGHAGNDTFVVGAGVNQVWAYTDGYGGHPLPGWDPGADTFAFKIGQSGTTTVHTFDPAHDDTLRFFDPGHHTTTLAQLDKLVTVTNGPAGDFAHQGDVTIAWKSGAESVTLANFFNADNPLHAVHSLAELSQYIHIDVARDWFG